VKGRIPFSKRLPIITGLKIQNIHFPINLVSFVRKLTNDMGEDIGNNAQESHSEIVILSLRSQVNKKQDPSNHLLRNHIC